MEPSTVPRQIAAFPLQGVPGQLHQLPGGASLDNTQWPAPQRLSLPIRPPSHGASEVVWTRPFVKHLEHAKWLSILSMLKESFLIAPSIFPKQMSTAHFCITEIAALKSTWKQAHQLSGGLSFCVLALASGTSRRFLVSN